MAVAGSSRPRVFVDGKFFRLGDKKFHVKGVAYGPLPPDAQGLPFASPEKTARDFAQIRELGANVLRLYEIPPRWFLDLAADRNLKVFIDVPWNRHLCFDSRQRREEAREAVRRAVYACAHHPAIFAFSIANEIPADIVRWVGARAVEDLIDELVLEAKRVDPDCLCTYTNFPSTEFLKPRCVDFVCFNLYLHEEVPFRNYLARLQMIAEAKPLLLGETGIDSIREGEDRKREILSWQIGNSFRAGLAGVVVFSFTDEWFRGDTLVTDWQMGLVTAAREPKKSFAVVKQAFAAAPIYPLTRTPMVSVVVASYNGERTLRSCLDSLARLRYPDYEIILVDDGSTDTTPQIASAYPRVRSLRHDKNLGLSAARNTGIAAATGEIIAFTDSDCRADEDWLYYLVGTLLEGDFAGVGGPNLLPPEDSRVATAVMVSPGGPTHVMLTDRRAEHIPGCNMAFFKRALDEIGGFDPIFTRAGDDVDVCWRVQQAGHEIGFSPAAFVWHYRRSTVRTYLRQQEGYGEAEAMLVRKHPENFNSFGGGIWRGRIYGTAKFGVELRSPIIYHGLFGSAGFQKLYAAAPATALMLCTTLEYHLFVTLPLWIVSVVFHYLFPVAIAALLLPIAMCAIAGAQAALPKNKARWWSRPLVALLFFLQPIVRGFARYRGRLTAAPRQAGSHESIDSVALRQNQRSLDQVQYWSETRIDRVSFVSAIQRRLEARGLPGKADGAWNDFDLELFGNRWIHLQLTTAVEDHPKNRQLVRCRLRGVWSLAARATFAFVFAMELVVIGLAGFERSWPWLLLLTLPALALFITHQRRKLQSVTIVFLNELAKERGMTRIVT